MMTMKNSLRACALVLLSLSLSGCLKSRMQVRGEDRDEAPRVAPGAVQSVPAQPHMVDELKAEITRLNGRMEDLERARGEAARENNAAQRDEARKLEARMSEMERAQASIIDALKKMQEAMTSPTTVSRVPERSGGEGGDGFERAKSLYDAKNYDGAVESFTAFLRHAKGAKAEEATYLRGDAYFQQKLYKKAIVDLSKFPEKYTRSKRMPAALLKIGQSFEALGMKEDAKGFYQEVVEKYPKSPEAKKARAKVK